MDPVVKKVAIGAVVVIGLYFAYTKLIKPKPATVTTRPAEKAGAGETSNFGGCPPYMIPSAKGCVPINS